MEIHETRNKSDRNRRFGASCTIINGLHNSGVSIKFEVGSQFE